LTVVAGAVTFFETLLVAVTVIFNRSPNFVIRSICPLVFLLVLKISAGSVSYVLESGVVTV